MFAALLLTATVAESEAHMGFPISAPLPPGRFNFKIIGDIGRGGFGVVDEIEVVASNSNLVVGSRHARKRLNESFNTHPEARERFEREIAQVRAMADIPGVVAFRGENLPGGERFYVMPRYPQSLRQFIAANGARPWREVARFSAAVADTMGAAHARGCIHRDLKPENLLLTTSNGHVVADWGLGYFMHQHSKVLMPLTRGGMGSEYYCSMEQWASGKCDAAGDIYSLGMLTAELVLGAQAAILHQGAGLAADIATEASYGAQDFNRLLRVMTSVLPQKRPQTMGDVADSLRAAAAR